MQYIESDEIDASFQLSKNKKLSILKYNINIDTYDILSWYQIDT